MNDSTVQAYIKLDQFLKWQGIAQTGGEAKIIIKQGLVMVNGESETRRGRKLVTGDRVSVDGTIHRVELK
ncbi:MAG: RNA-binding S4 domain-containing protein [Cyanobacteria bacterium J06629_2]